MQPSELPLDGDVLPQFFNVSFFNFIHSKLPSEIMSWFEKLLPSRIRTEGKKSNHTVPEGLWIKCPCVNRCCIKELERNVTVCPKCSHHLRIGAQ